MPVQQLANVCAPARSVRALALGATALALVTSIPAFAGPGIGVSQTVNASTLGANDTPDFNGGTLKIDAAGPFAQNMTLEPAPSSTAATVSTVDENGHNVIFSGIISNANTNTGDEGSIVFTDSVGGGNVTLNGVNSYSGSTTINSGATLSIGSSGTIDASDLVAVNGTFDISKATGGTGITTLAGAGNVVLGSNVLSITAGASTFSGVISGTGSVVLTAGSETLSGDNTYTGGTQIASGTLTVGAGSTTGTILGNVADAGTLAFDRADNISFDGTITGTGGLTQLGGGALTLTNTDTYTGPTNVAAGTLVLSPTGDISSSSNVTVSGILDISQTNGTSLKSLSGAGTVQLGGETLTLTSASGTFTGGIQGTGGLTITGGTETLTGNNSYTGTTLVSGGILRLGSSAVSINVTDNATVSFFSSTPVAVTGVISGNGAVTQTGNGVTTISSVQTYTGATTISLGTLALSGTGSIAASSSVEDDATFDVSAVTSGGGATIASLSGSGTVQLGSQTLTLSSAAGTFAGIIAGTGNLVLASGTETLTSGSTFTGNTTIASGTLFLTSTNALIDSARVTDNGTLDVSGVTTSGLVPAASINSLGGNGLVVLGSKLLQITNGGDTFSGTISGTGGIIVSGGTETLTGSNTYTGTTTIGDGGILKLAGAGSLSSSGTIDDSGVFDISGSGSGTVSLAALSGDATGTVTLGANNLNLVNGGGAVFAGAISGAGSLTISGGTQILSGANSYSGGTTIAAGTLQLGNGTASGSLTGNVTDNGNLAFARTDSSAFDGVISGTGTVTQAGTGTTALTATNTYSGGTVITAGTLQIGNGGTTGSITGNVTDNGTLGFDRSDATTFSGNISGTGGIALTGTGTLTLTGVESYTGATNIAGVSTLVVANGASIATSSDVIDNGTLDISTVAAPQLASLGGSGSILTGGQTLTITNGVDTFAGSITGVGGLTVTGGNEILSGTNTYTGATTVNGGTLTVNGSVSNSSGVTVNSGGTLAGSGTTAKVAVNSGGTLAPSAGLTINGGLSMTSGSTFLATMTSGTASKVTVDGAATIAGTLAVSNGGGNWLLGQKETVLTATDGVSGTFTPGTITSTGAQYAESISYDADDVFVTVNLSKLTPLLPTGATANAAAPIAGIDAAIARGDSVPTNIQNLANLTSTQLGAAAPQLAGQIAADLPQAGVAMMTPFIEAMTDHQADAGPGRASVWVTGYGGSDLVNGNSAVGSDKFKQHVAGLVLGMDRTFGRGGALTLGGALSFGSSNFHLPNNDGVGSADTIQGGIYGTMRTGRILYGAFNVALASDTMTTQRSVTTTSTDTLLGHGKTLAFAGRYEEGANLGWLIPYVALDDTLVRTPDYTESAEAGVDTFALHYGSRSSNFANVELGVRQRSDTLLGRDWTLTLTDRLAWQHTLAGVWDAQGNFASVADSTFTTLGAQPTKDAGLLTLGAELRERSGFNVNLHVESAIGRNSQSYTAIGGLGYSW